MSNKPEHITCNLSVLCHSMVSLPIGPPGLIVRLTAPQGNNSSQLGCWGHFHQPTRFAAVPRRMTCMVIAAWPCGGDARIASARKGLSRLASRYLTPMRSSCETGCFSPDIVPLRCTGGVTTQGVRMRHAAGLSCGLPARMDGGLI